jgi:hypothetical protein
VLGFSHLEVPVSGEPNSNPSGSAVETGRSDKPLKKPFRKLFSLEELWHYGIAAVVYISLGLLFQDAVLNFAVGPLFIVLWMWWVPPLINKWRARRR